MGKDKKEIKIGIVPHLENHKKGKTVLIIGAATPSSMFKTETTELIELDKENDFILLPPEEEKERGIQIIEEIKRPMKSLEFEITRSPIKLFTAPETRQERRAKERKRKKRK